LTFENLQGFDLLPERYIVAAKMICETKRRKIVMMKKSSHIFRRLASVFLVLAFALSISAPGCRGLIAYAEETGTQTTQVQEVQPETEDKEDAEQAQVETIPQWKKLLFGGLAIGGAVVVLALLGSASGGSGGSTENTNSTPTYTPAAAEIVASGECGAQEDNLTWTLDSNGLLTISGSGDMEEFYGGPPWRELLSSIKKIVIKAGVTSIGAWAFFECKRLTSVEIPSSVTSIGSVAFEECKNLTTVTLPYGVKSIGNKAFYGCEGLTGITIPNSVTSIGYRAFYHCESLTSLKIPNSVTSIGDEAFAYCKSLTSITIPSSVTNIGDSTLAYCTSLTSVTIPNSVTSIGDKAFAYCARLTGITIPGSVTSIGEYAFAMCSNLKTISYGGTCEAWQNVTKTDSDYSGITIRCADGTLAYQDDVWTEASAA
jgi:hypothetical protein